MNTSAPVSTQAAQIPDPLAELRDIHLPDAIAWWPPAPGWWILSALCICSVIGLAWWMLRRRRRLAPRRQALRELEQSYNSWRSEQDAGAFLYAVSTLLRRSLISAGRRMEIASLHGEAWLRRLDELIGGADFSSGQGRVLADGLYRPQVDIDADALYALARRAISAMPPAGAAP